MGNTSPAQTGIKSGPNRVPRVLFFTAGMVPTEDDYSDAEKFLPNMAFRNAAQVSAMPFSPLEECDAVAGSVIPERYLKVYPNVTDFEGGRLLRLSDLDRPHGPVASPDNEAARAAKPPAQGETNILGSQGATRPAGATTQAGGGFVAPQPVGTANVAAFGSERAENARTGAVPANPQGLPDGGVSLVSDANAPLRDVLSGLSAPVAPGGGFLPPEPAKPAEGGVSGEGVADKQETAAQRKRREAEEAAERAKGGGEGTN